MNFPSSATQFPNVPRAADEPFFAPTPDEIRAKMSQLNVEFNTLDATIRSQPQVNPAFLTSWNAQLADWRAFVANTTSVLDNPLSSAGNFFTSTRVLDRQLEEYRFKLIGWSQAFRLQNPNAVPAGPQPQLPPVPQTPPPASGGLPWWVTSALTVAAVGGVAYLGYRAYQSVRGGATILRLASRDNAKPPFLPYPESSRDMRGRAPRRMCPHDHEYDE